MSNIENKQEELSCKIDAILKIVSYKRVPGFDKESSTVYDYVSNIVRSAILHEKAFGDERYKYINKDVVVTVTGPTFEYYKPMKKAIHFGANTAYRKRSVRYSALFCQDHASFGGKLPRSFIYYRGKSCKKYIGNNLNMPMMVNLDKYAVYNYMSENKFNYLIDIAPLPDFCSVVFSVMSYALWTHPKRIYLVGADCSSGHAKITDSKNNTNVSYLIEPWNQMARFISKFYSDIEIISINPIGLKGLFKDVYTREFLADHPEIDINSVELLEDYQKKTKIKWYRKLFSVSRDENYRFVRFFGITFNIGKIKNVKK